jgi:hypothetical protein
MRFQRVSCLTFWLSLPIAFFAAHGVHAQSAHVDSAAYPTVTDERLQHPEAGDWLMYRRTYDGCDDRENEENYALHQQTSS